MCINCFSTPPGHYTDKAHEERDKILFKFMSFCNRAADFTRRHDKATVKRTFDDLHQMNHKFSYRDFVEGTNTLY